MEDSDEFKCAVKVVIKRQMRDLMEQLRDSGEEVAVMTVNLDDNTCSHFGSPNGEWFMSEQKDITQSFLNFCQSNTSGDSGKKSEGPVRTASPPKKKSISSLKDSSIKQNMSNDIPEVKVTVPKSVAGDLSEEDVAALVGRIVATHLAVQEKGDGSSSGTQFDILVRTANHSRTKNASSVQSTPARSSRKRKPTAKYMEGMSTLKKSKKSEEEDTGSEMEAGNEEVSVISLLSELSNTVLRRVKVSISDNKSVNLERYNIDSTEITEALAVLVINELDTVSGGHLANKKSVKVTVLLDEAEEEVVRIRMKCDHSKVANTVKQRTEHSGYSTFEEELDCIDNDSENDAFSSDGDNDMDDDDLNISPELAKKRRRSELRPRQPYYQPQTCKVCSKVIIGAGGLSSHVRRVHMGERNYKCVICSKAFFKNYTLEKHMLNVHERKKANDTLLDDGDSDIEDDLNCPKEAKKRKLAKMRRRRSSYQPETCHLCHKVIIGVGNLRSHVRRVHMNERNFKCDLCSKAFFKNYNLEKHMLNVHKQKDLKKGEQRTENAVKGQDFSDLNPNEAKKRLDKIRARQPSYRPETCQLCSKVIIGVGNLKNHIRRVHQGEKNFKCVVCSKAFFKNFNLEKHMLTMHSKQCKECGENVFESTPWEEGVTMKSQRVLICKCGNSEVICYSRKYKEKSVKKELGKPATQYACEYCGKLFSRKSHVMRHSKLHTDNVNSCDHCCQTFRTKIDLKKHLAEIHGLLAYSCKVCSDSFKSSADLTVHMKAHQALGETTSTTGHHEEQIQTSTVLSKPLISIMDNATSAVSTTVNDMPETYTIKIVRVQDL